MKLLKNILFLICRKNYQFIVLLQISIKMFSSQNNNAANSIYYNNCITLCN